jgi:hypothetical protein
MPCRVTGDEGLLLKRRPRRGILSHRLRKLVVGRPTAHSHIDHTSQHAEIGTGMGKINNSL